MHLENCTQTTTTNLCYILLVFIFEAVYAKNQPQILVLVCGQAFVNKANLYTPTSTAY